jgi:leader peptidase (prepilin peptidase)/N-methyltransferase
VDAALAAIVFLPGLAIGSFLNVVAARIPRGMSVVHPPSACPSCEAPIAWYDNIPVLSWLVLRGRCRNCRAPIPWKYPVVELGTALLVVGCFLKFGVTAEAVLASFFCAVLVVLSVTDIERLVIPNRIVLPAAAVMLVGQTAINRSPEWVIAGLAASGLLFLLAVAYPDGMGMGDVKLALLLGFGLGRTVPVAIMIGVVAALVPSIVLLARHGRAARKMKIPFGAFLALGGIVALFAGQQLLDAYLGLL